MRPEGPICQGCGKSEVGCVKLNCECCSVCTHTFDGGETHKYLCFGCNRIIHTDKHPSGPPRRLCPYCAGLRDAGHLVPTERVS